MATRKKTLWIVGTGLGDLLRRIRILVQASSAKNGASYWTIVVRRTLPAKGARAAQADGETLATFSQSTRLLTKNVPVTLYENDAGLSMEEGEALVATMTSTGTPADLEDPVFLLDIDHNTR